MGVRGWIIIKLVVYDFRVLNTNLAIRGADGDVIGNKAESASQNIYIQVIDHEGVKNELLAAQDEMRQVSPATTEGPPSACKDSWVDFKMVAPIDRPLNT